MRWSAALAWRWPPRLSRCLLVLPEEAGMGLTLPRYVVEFEGRHNQRPLDTDKQMAIMAVNADGKRIRYSELIGPKDTRQPRML